MKYILLLLLLPFTVQAQNNAERYEFDSSISIPGKYAGRIFTRACNVTRKYATEYYVSSGKAERRYQLQDDDQLPFGKIDELLGYYYSSRPKGLVKAHGLCLYEPVNDKGCIGMMLIAWDIEIRCVRDEADVTITNLRYCNYSRTKDGAVVPLGDGEKQIAGKGQYEELMRSTVCAEEMQALNIFVRNAANETLRRIKDEMKPETNDIDL